jgi:WD40 repeat protein
LNSVSNKIIKEKQFSQATATCVALSDDLLFVGNSEGQVWMFDREAEDEYSTFSEKSKEFLGNSVTCIDVHPLRTEYVVLGYERGQLVMFDATEPNKSIKVIKDHHKNVPVINIKFCDWQTSG